MGGGYYLTAGTVRYLVINIAELLLTLQCLQGSLEVPLSLLANPPLLHDELPFLVQFYIRGYVRLIF